MNHYSPNIGGRKANNNSRSLHRIILDNNDEESNEVCHKKDLCSRIVDWCDDIDGNNSNVSRITILVILNLPNCEKPKTKCIQSKQHRIL